MKFSVDGPDLDVLFKLAAALPAFSALPTKIEVDNVREDVTADWVGRWLPKAEREVWAEWPENGLLSNGLDKVVARSRTFTDLAVLARVVAEWPFELAVFWTPYGLDWKAASYRSPGFSDGHLPHGWACMFKGTGHDRLVSRRWLEQDVWKVTKLPGDVSLVEFYDLNASPDVALEQAKIGHARMGISKTGGFLQTGYAYHHQPKGVYDLKTKTYKEPVAVRALPQEELLDLCALRAEKRNDPETPIDVAGFAFVMGEDEARPYLRELWLRELGCWAVVAGHDVRLDDKYEPPALTAPW